MTREHAAMLRRLDIQQANLENNELLIKLVYCLVKQLGGNVSFHVRDACGTIEPGQVLTIDEYDKRTFTIRITAR